MTHTRSPAVSKLTQGPSQSDRLCAGAVKKGSHLCDAVVIRFVVSEEPLCDLVNKARTPSCSSKLLGAVLLPSIKMRQGRFHSTLCLVCCSAYFSMPVAIIMVLFATCGWCRCQSQFIITTCLNMEKCVCGLHSMSALHRPYLT